MRKSLLQKKNEVISLFLETIQVGKTIGKIIEAPTGDPVDGDWLSQQTNTHLSKSLHMSAGEASHFIKGHMLGINFDNFAVIRKKKNGRNGGNVYTLEDLLNAKEEPNRAG